MSAPEGKASPRPWKVETVEAEWHTALAILAEGQSRRVTTLGDPQGNPMHAANAALIVRAVNNFDALLEAAKAVDVAACAYEADPVNAYDRPSSWGKLDALLSAVADLRAALRAAIAAAEGETT